MEETELSALPQPPEPEPKELLRKEANVQGGVLLINRAIMTIAVTIAMMVGAVIWAMDQAFGNMTNDDQAIEELMDWMLQASGWGYLLAIGIGMLILLLWKKPQYIRHQIAKRGKPMTLGSFLAVFCLFMSGQLLYQLFVYALEAFLQLFDISILEFLESNAADTSQLGMLLYVGIGAPFFEEIVFRGVMLRSLEPFGKKFSIFMTALFFGLYHGNLPQSIYAMAVGLVLGYVALEYNIVWAMVLHMINNLIFAGTLPRILELLPHGMGDAVMQVLTALFFVAAVIIVIVRRKEIAQRWQQESMPGWKWKAMFGSPTIIILIVLCALEMLTLGLMMLIV